MNDLMEGGTGPHYTRVSVHGIAGGPSAHCGMTDSFMGLKQGWATPESRPSNIDPNVEDLPFELSPENSDPQ